MKQSRIQIITRNMPPLVGGMERLNWHMADELSKNAEVMIIGPKGSGKEKPATVTLQEAPLKPLPLFLIVALLKGLWSAWRWKPDTVLAGSGLTAPLAWLISKLCRTRSAVYLHGFDITVDHWLYRIMWRPVFKKMDRVIVNSTPTRKLTIDAGVDEKKISIIHPGVALPSAKQSPDSIHDFKLLHGLVEKKILLSVGRLTTRKGLREFVELSLPAIAEAFPDVVLVVIGDAPKDSLGASSQTMESIQDLAEKKGLADHIKFLGVITDTRVLATAYESADVHVFPVRNIPNDPEGFGMVAIEAAAHSLPTAAFRTGGIIDAVKHGESGVLVKSEDYSGLAEQIIVLLKDPLPQKGISAFAEQFNWFHFGNNIADALC